MGAAAADYETSGAQPGSAQQCSTAWQPSPHGYVLQALHGASGPTTRALYSCGAQAIPRACASDWTSMCACQVDMCKSAGHVLGGEGKKPSPAKAAALGPRVPNLADAWARVHLARLCAALLLAEWTSAGEFAGGVGAPLLRMLVLLATRCAAPARHLRFRVRSGRAGAAHAGAAGHAARSPCPKACSERRVRGCAPILCEFRSLLQSNEVLLGVHSLLQRQKWVLARRGATCVAAAMEYQHSGSNTQPSFQGPLRPGGAGDCPRAVWLAAPARAAAVCCTCCLTAGRRPARRQVLLVSLPCMHRKRRLETSSIFSVSDGVDLISRFAIGSRGGFYAVGIQGPNMWRNCRAGCAHGAGGWRARRRRGMSGSCQG